MKQVYRLLTIIVLFLFGVFQAEATYAEDETKFIVTETSSQTDIIKVQKIFQKIGVYSGEIDGKHASVRPTIIKLQKEFAIITSETDSKTGKIDASLLNRTISAYVKTPERKEKIQKEKAKAKAETTVKETSSPKVANVDGIVTDRKFIVTAYYSPLRGQKKYSTGSYWGDIRLNGEGTHGASGAAVYKGFLAAPKNYPFGTKIYLEGIGVGVVEDRGGAIVNAGKRGHEYDRIDVWMGYGDTGLQRALQWGKRTVDGKIIGEDAKIIDSFPETIASDYYDLRVNPESSAKEIKQLQELLKEIGEYDGAIDGKYKTVELPLMNYQKKKGIIINSESNGAGYFGPKTYNAVQRDLAGELKNAKSEPIAEVKKVDPFANVSRKDKDAMKARSTKILKELNVKAGGNRLVLDSYKRKIKEKLEKAVAQSSSTQEKDKLRYLISLL